MLNAEEITEMFTGPEGFRLARWQRPIVPVIFGVEDSTLAIFKGAIEAVVSMAGHKMAETDPEQGANCMVFVFRDWSELAEMPELDGLVPGLPVMAQKFGKDGTNRYRHFRFEETGAIRAAFLFLQMDAELSRIPAEDLALAEAAQLVLLWGQEAFRKRSPLARAGDRVILHPEIAALIRAAYDPIMPAASTEPAQALRLAARIGAEKRG